MKWKITLIWMVCGTCLACALPVTAMAQTAECGATASQATDDGTCTGDCPRKGDCDCPAMRDLWDVGSSAAEIKIPVRIHVLGGSPNDPSNDEMDDQVQKIKDDFDTYHINLDASWHRITDASEYETITSANLNDMKSDHAEDPDSQLNIYVTTYSGFSWIGNATFPWQSVAMGTYGGVLVDRSAVGGNKTTMTHEIGHILGLWHTHHGTGGEFGGHGGCPQGQHTVCDCYCYETADGEDCDINGDFCCDTPATPSNTDCEAPGGTDPCGEQYSWGVTDYENFMGYARDGGTPTCRDRFTTEQARRMHCWTCNELTEWIDDDTGTCCYSDDTCAVTTENCCTNSDGTFTSGVVDCSEDCNDNEIPDGCEAMACCLVDRFGSGYCIESTATDCASQGGTFNCGDTCAEVYCAGTNGPQGP